MGKPTICIGKNKTKTKTVTAKLISAFVFATRIVQFLFYLNPKFQASSSFLCLYKLICVGPVRKPHCWFSHEAAQMILIIQVFIDVCKPSQQFFGNLGHSHSFLSTKPMLWRNQNVLFYNKTLECQMPNPKPLFLGPTLIL